MLCLLSNPGSVVFGFLYSEKLNVIWKLYISISTILDTTKQVKTAQSSYNQIVFFPE